MLSTKAKEAIKTGLAIVIAYGIALSMNWENPYWAGFTVAFISLATIGQSINKGAMRMLGTLAASAVALSFIGLFSQDRWLFMVAVSSWVALCTYIMANTTRPYFWNVCGFVTVIICFDAGPNATDAFNTAILRAEETGLGVLVYSIVAVFLWPSSSRNRFDASVRNLVAAQHALYQAYLDEIHSGTQETDPRALKAAAIQAQSMFDQLLGAALTDTREVRQRRHQWERFQHATHALGEAMERWRDGFAELRSLDLAHRVPNLAEFSAELDRRFGAIAAMLAGEEPGRQPAETGLETDTDAGHALRHFDAAALEVARTEFRHIERLTRSLWSAAAGIKGFTVVDAPPLAPVVRRSAVFVPDPDHLGAIVKVSVTLWAAYLMVFYIGDFPGGFGFVTMATVFCMMTANVPHPNFWKMFVPAATGAVFAGVIYIFVMPKLSGFFGLAALLFIVTVAICYLFAAPQQALGKLFGLAMFLAVTAVSNEQTYSFLGVANMVLMFALVFLMLAVTAGIPFSRRPELRFLRQLRRFFRSCEFLIADRQIEGPDPRGPVRRFFTAFHAREVATLPAKLEAGVTMIDATLLPGDSTARLRGIVAELRMLARRMQILLEARETPQAAPLTRAFGDEIYAWRAGVERSLGRLAENPASGDVAAFRSGLQQITTQLEQRIQVDMDAMESNRVTAADDANFYRLLGAFRGLSEALVNYVEHAGEIDWQAWREPRFA